MGSSILKGRADYDLYCVWSSVVDGPTFIGTAKELIDFEARHEFDGGHMCRAIAPERTAEDIAKADEHGSSSRGRYGRWDDGHLIYEQKGMLPRSRLFDFLKLLDNDAWIDEGTEPEEALAMLEPFDDD